MSAAGTLTALWRAPWTQDLWLSAKNIFFPIFCKQCDAQLRTEENGYFCPTCWEGSPRIQRPFCTRCGRPHDALINFGMMNNFPCAACNENPNPHLRRVWGAACYEGAMEMAVKLFKFQGKTRLAPVLGGELCDFAAREMAQEVYDCIIPVPLHPVRRRERGFNQSLLLAEAVQTVFPGAVVAEHLKRIRPTRIQSRLTKEERHASITGAFAVPGDECAGKRILLVDDVVTTGGTINECARVLRRAGAASVDVLAVALTLLGRPEA